MSEEFAHSTEDMTRAAAYRFLARVFAEEIDETTFSSVSNGDLRQLLDELSCASELRETVDLLKFNLDQRGDRDKTLMDLRVMFAKLFLGAGGRRAAPPYASYYATNRQSLSHPCVADIHALYRSYDLEPQTRFPEPADHIALMLSFLSALILKGTLPKEQEVFLSTYLQPAVLGFAADCSANDEDGFYLACASLLKNMVEKDLHTLN